MRQEPHNEIDLLLRQLSRRNGVPVSDMDEQHLDADELNSYVANALPPGARARYTQHLADCSGCRKLVAQLSAAQGPVMVQESANVVAPSGLESFLASLLSPMVLRYAVPALGLIVIAVVGIFFLNDASKRTSVAQLQDADQYKSVAQSPSPVETPIPIEKEVPVLGLVDRPAKEGPAAKEGPVAKEAPATTDAAAPTGATTQPSEPISTPAAAAAPPAPKAAASSEAEVRGQVEVQKKREEAAAAPTVAGASSATQNANEPVKNDYRNRDSLGLTPGTAIRRAEQRSAKTGQATRAREDNTQARDDKKTEADQAKTESFAYAETRSVAGRSFRKSGSGWIDTAYKSSTETTNVARGSEQYRGLVADEPSIRDIAEQLDGEIIVVWKGRAYRIR